MDFRIGSQNEFNKIKKKKMRKLKSIREKKEMRKNENHPTTAYVMLGHGSDYLNDNELVVPKGCIVVVQTHIGEYNYNVDFNPFFTATKEMEEKFLDPINNYDFVVDILKSKGDAFEKLPKQKSLAIYKAGDKCPNFTYTLFSSYPTRFGRMIRYSGLYEIPRKGDTFNDTMNFLLIVNKDKLIKILQDSFSHSSDSFNLLSIHINYILNLITSYIDLYKNKKVYDILYINYTILASLLANIYNYYIPINLSSDKNSWLKESINIRLIVDSKKIIDFNEVIKTIVNIITNLNNNNNSNKLSDITVNSIIEQINILTEINQKTLFDMVYSNKLKPAVFYNLVCRSNETTKMLVKNHNSIFSSSMRNLILNNKDIHIKNNSDYEKHLKKHIIEAELHRKPYIKRLYPNNTRKNDSNNIYTYTKNGNKYKRNISQKIINKFVNNLKDISKPENTIELRKLMNSIKEKP